MKEVFKLYLNIFLYSNTGKRKIGRGLGHGLGHDCPRDHFEKFCYMRVLGFVSEPVTEPAPDFSFPSM